jgi:hypothetical protein
MFEFSFFHLTQEFVKDNLLLLFIDLLVYVNEEILFRFDDCQFISIEHIV